MSKSGSTCNSPSSTRKTWMWVGVVVLACAGAAGWYYASAGARHPSPNPVSAMPGAPPRLNLTAAPGPGPEGMVWIPGGEFSMGAQDPPGMDEVGMKATTDSRPIHRVYVDGFWMDKTELTNEQFEKFTKATGYVTVAERAPRAEDFPGAPPK